MEGGYTRRKQPEIVRRALLDNAARLAVDHGLAAVTVQAVADAAGVTKGGLLHHFPSKQDLVNAVFKDLLDALDRDLDERIAADSDPYGSFTRAYLEAVLDIEPETKGGLLAKLSISMLTDVNLRAMWAQWFNARLQRHHVTDGDLVLSAVRLAADGIWLADLTGMPIENREILRAILLKATHPSSKGKDGQTS